MKKSGLHHHGKHSGKTHRYHHLHKVGHGGGVHTHHHYHPTHPGHHTHAGHIGVPRAHHLHDKGHGGIHDASHARHNKAHSLPADMFGHAGEHYGAGSAGSHRGGAPSEAENCTYC